MPWKKKQHQFRGVAKQFIPVNSADSVSSDVAVCTVNVADLNAKPPTASQKKLEQNSPNVFLNNYFDGPVGAVGYRLINLECLEEAMSKLHMCKDGR